jgi:protein-disulfide isomerase
MKRYLSSTILSVLATSLLCASVATAQESAEAKPLSKTDVEAIVKQVINNNPELIMGSLQKYQMKKQAEEASETEANIGKMQDKLVGEKNTPSIGNPKGDVTVVEFFDYHCGYCKQFLPTITQLMADDHNLRLVFKEFPILSPDSALAAKAALAVNKIDKTKYLAFHTSLMKMSGTFTTENLTNKATEAGISKEAFEKTMKDPELDKEIEANRELANSLNIHGTPAIIVGNQFIPGVVPLSELKVQIAEARAEAKKKKS